MKLLVGRYLSPDLRYALFTVIPKHEVGTKKGDDLVHSLRDTAAAFTSGSLKHDEIHVGGAAAGYLDFDDALQSKFPFVVAVVLVLT